MSPCQLHPPTIGLFYAGDMGCAVGRLLREQGLRVVTTVEGRSERTRRLCAESGLETLSTFAEVVREAELAMALVPPAAALAVARHYRRQAKAAHRSATYVDVNSISPLTSRKIAALFAASPVRFVDAAIHGLARNLRRHGTLYLSGAHAGDVAAIFSPVVRVCIAGDQPGQASAFKMLLGGMSKGLTSLFLELGRAAGRCGVLDEFLLDCRHYYPGVMEAIDRLAPTCPRHAGRRSDEMRELESTLRDIGLQPEMARGARHTLAATARHALAERYPDRESGWTARQVVEALEEIDPPQILNGMPAAAFPT